MSRLWRRAPWRGHRCNTSGVGVYGNYRLRGIEGPILSRLKFNRLGEPGVAKAARHHGCNSTHVLMQKGVNPETAGTAVFGASSSLPTPCAKVCLLAP
jgi:hypothetical protein